MANDAPLPPALAALAASGRIDVASVAPLRGNRDRADATRSTWRARLADGRVAKLTVGPALAALAARHRAFARACPSLVPVPLFFESSPAGDVFAEEFFAGTPVDALPVDHAAHAIAQAATALAGTARRSTPGARQQEWNEWTAQLLAAPAWNDTERTALRDSLLPRLFGALTTEPPTTRWTNGDFLAANLLADAHGAVRLVDCEFAQATHFWREDAVRFHTLSPLARQHPALFTSAIPDAGPAWHLFFWLRQWTLELAHNSSDYLERVRTERLATMRRLAEVTLGCDLPGWTESAAPVHTHLEQASWSPHDARTVEIRGWCHVPNTALRAVVLCAGEQRLAEAPLTARPDVRAHLGDPAAEFSGFALRATLPSLEAAITISAHTGDGMLLPFASLEPRALPGRVAAIGNFARWAALHDPVPPPPTTPPSGPLFSILLPVYRTPLPLLRACVASVRAQHYPHWELCIVDDASRSTELTAELATIARDDARIRLLPRAQNGGIARATNDALAAARGEFIALLDHDDELRPHALLAMAEAIARQPDAALLYSDEDKIAEDGARLMPFLKPGFSPEFLLGVMYFGHLLCVRTELARRVGGFDPAFDGVQDFEFALRVTEHTRAVVHVPEILYHWRQTAASSALHGNVKGNMDARQAAAVHAHLARVGRTEIARALGGHRVRLEPSSPPSVSVISGDIPAWTHAAKQTHAEVLVLLAPGVEPPDAATQALLAAAALRPDAGFVAPVLLAPDGRVLDAGWTRHDGGFTALLRGFASDGDGFNGSLRCTREVAAVAPVCVAVSRARFTAATSATNWFEMLANVGGAQHFHRIVGGAQLISPLDTQPLAAAGSATALADPFYNPRFDAKAGDYTLRRDWPAARPVWHLDTPLPAGSSDGCLHWRGWCHWPGRTLREIRLQLTSDFTWSATLGLPRSDVAAQLGEPAARDCGFEARLRLPAGGYTIRATALAADGAEAPLFACATEVTAWARARYAFAAAPEKLLAFQFLAGPTQAPAALPTPRMRRSASSSRPRFAIVTPSYQHAPFLGRCLRSVIEQEGVAIDYVVQDGGSTDGSRDIIAAHARHLHAWASERDAGQADAIARGFARTSGAPDDAMAWLNSDDFYLPGTLATVADFFARHPEVDVIYGHRCVVDDKDRLIGRWIVPRHDDDVLRLNDFVPQETLFWRRRLWDRVGGIDRSLQFALDWDLLLRFQAAGARMVRLPVFLGCFRVHPAQKTSAAMHHVGQAEIDWLRIRTHGRFIAPGELVAHPTLQRYLRASARREWTSLIRPD